MRQLALCKIFDATGYISYISTFGTNYLAPTGAIDTNGAKREWRQLAPISAVGAKRQRREIVCTKGAKSRQWR